MDLSTSFENIYVARLRYTSKDSGVGNSAFSSPFGSPTNKLFPFVDSPRQRLPIPQGFPLSESFFDFLYDDHEFGEIGSRKSALDQDGLHNTQQSVLCSRLLAISLHQSAECANFCWSPVSNSVSFDCVDFQPSSQYQLESVSGRAITKKTPIQDDGFESKQVERDLASAHLLSSNQAPMAMDVDLKMPRNGGSARSGAPKKKHSSKKIPDPTCAFCRNNGKADNHPLRNRRDETVCPILCAMKCRVCGATGKNAHTERHCPVAEMEKRRKLESGE